MWIYGLAALAAFIVSACQRDSESSNSKSEPSPPPSGSAAPPATAKSDAAAQPPPSPGPSSIMPLFGSDWRATSAYNKLLEGNKDEDKLKAELNVGCKLPAPFDEKVSERDSLLLPCELRQRTFDSYPSPPYLEAARILMGGSIPFSLDDFDPKTTFDEGIQKKVTAAVESLKNVLGIKLDGATDEQKEKLALGLYHFVHFPDFQERIQADSKNLYSNTEELKKAGLGGFQDYLFKNGGLGVSLFTKIPGGDPHLPALEALQTRTGSDFSRANILFGAFTLAGFRPYFLITPSQKLDPEAKPDIHEGQIRINKQISVLVGLNIGPEKDEKSIIFNPSTLGPRPNYNGNDMTYYTLNRYYGLYLFARGADESIRTGKFGQGISYLERSLDVIPASAVTRMMLGFAYEHTNNNESAENNLRESLRLDPDNDLANYYLGNLLYQAGKRKDALPYYLKAVKGHPGWAEPQGAYIIPLAAQEALATDPKDATALEIQTALKENKTDKGTPQPSTVVLNR